MLNVVIGLALSGAISAVTFMGIRVPRSREADLEAEPSKAEEEAA